MAERPKVQVVCTPLTAIVEEDALFLKARQLVMRVLPLRNNIVRSRLPSPRKFTKGFNSVPRCPARGRHRAYERSIESRGGAVVDVSTRLAALELPASWLLAWLRHNEALEEGDDADMDVDTDGVGTWLQSSGEAWLSVQPVLEYASLSYGPVHAVSRLQWEEIKVLHSTEQPRRKWNSEFATAVAGRSPVSTPPCIGVQVVLLWFHEGQMYRLMPEELVSVATKARGALTARSLPPPRAATTGLSVEPSPRSLFTCYMTLEYPPGTLCPQRVPVPIAEPLLTRQELVELVRATANICRHHPLRVAYRVWPQATTPTVAAPVSAPPWFSGRAGVSSAAPRAAVATPTMRAPPLHALESDAALVGFIRDILAYGCPAVQIVAVRSGVTREPQKPSCAQHKMRRGEEMRAAFAMSSVRIGDVSRGITRKDSATQYDSVYSRRRLARAASPSPMGAAAEQNGFRAAGSLPSDKEDEEAVRESGRAPADTVCTNEASDELACVVPAEAGGTAALAREVSGTESLASCGNASSTESSDNHQLHTRRPPSSIRDRDAKASREDGAPQLLLRDAAPPSLSEEATTGSITPAGEAALQGDHHDHLSNADEFGETRCNTDQFSEYIPGEVARDAVDAKLRWQQQQQLQHATPRGPHLDSTVQGAALVEDARDGEVATLAREDTSAKPPEKLMAVSSWKGHWAPHTPPVRTPASSPRKMSGDPGGVSAQAAEGATTDNVHIASPSPHGKSACSVSTTQKRRTTSISCGSATKPDPATVVLVRYEVDPTAVCITGPVQQTVLQHLQEVIFQRCCIHLCNDPDAPPPRFHATHHHRHAGSGDCNVGDATLPIASTTDASCTEFILPLHQYTFTRVEEDALERCIAEVMATCQGLELLPAPEAEKWIRTAPSLVSLRCQKCQQVGNSKAASLLS
ncbi:hypothetical protein, unknown function [Leishmania tarentolae]|uniref:Uncharacterized protein n=1 Tax=Leishmania tarentolae TaxID=5689 RepID=A0A640KGF5_LEITA|nr:hypothetical protein, unknown function [Leishmania tarentolae]